ncbi:phosphotransferase [Microbacterium sp.]|uniref:phosphotransferase family protein n=1 Tax=Microbacterium sp. TaxID=51671 RepID=UPI002811A992|nr:phosphotransferase [Microbacterium sp.]
MKAGADRLRPEWRSLPSRLRERVRSAIGGDIVADSPSHGGFSACYAGTVRTTSGRAFVKAIAPDGHVDSRTFLRREIGVLRTVPATLAPAVLAGFDDDGVALVLEVVDGEHPGAPWSEAQLHAIASEMSGLAHTTAAESVPAAEQSMLPDFARWSAIDRDHDLRSGLPTGLLERMPALQDLDTQLPHTLAGTALVHGDLRADNILIHDGRARLLDWPHALRGAAWLDLPLLLPSVEASGGPRCEDAWELFRVHGAPPMASLLPAISAFASFLWWGQAQPEIPELPGLRAFQRAQSVAALRWLDAVL